MAGNEECYSEVITPMLSQFCISKVERGAFNFLKIAQSLDFFVSLSQDTKAFKVLQSCGRILDGKESRNNKTGQFLYLDLTRPDLKYMVSELSRSSSKTPDVRLVVARALLKRVKEPIKSITYSSSNMKKLDLVCSVDASYNQNTVMV